MALMHSDDTVTLYHGDCIAVMRELPDASVDAVVTDPPYELGFMGKGWDASGIAYHPEVWTNALRVLKPGGHLLASGGTRTWHRLAVAIEDAGFEVRDSIAWMYGSGFPKSLDVSKAIDKAAGAERPREMKFGAIAPGANNYGGGATGGAWVMAQTNDAQTPAAQQWQGWGTALKPAFEPVVVARKPLIGTVAQNVERYGTGALNIDACRIGTEVRTFGGVEPERNTSQSIGAFAGDRAEVTVTGRWPANVILDESQAAELDKQSGVTKDSGIGFKNAERSTYDAAGRSGPLVTQEFAGYGGEGGASRFFYTAKADSSERPRVDGVAHPTVKPLDLMRYLVRLVTPPGGIVLEPFAGSGTTLEACIVEGFACIGIEREADYIPLIMARITKPIEPVLC